LFKADLVELNSVLGVLKGRNFPRLGVEEKELLQIVNFQEYLDD